MADDLDRLTLLERAHRLHDATLHRHGRFLDRQVDDVAALQRLQVQQDALNAQLVAMTARLTTEASVTAERLTRAEQAQHRHDELLAALVHMAQDMAIRLTQNDTML